MQLLVPDILADGRGLSVALSGAGLLIGCLLWLTGWWGHRFWVVLAATVSAGIFGLVASPIHGVQPIVAGLLLAVAAGVLALALVRMVAFAAGGLAVWLAVHALAPPRWDDPLICFLAGGLVGLLLFRVWVMALSSGAGTLLMGYSGLCLADRLGKVDAVALTDQNVTLLNWVCVGLAGLGFAVQFILERRRVLNERWHQQRQIEEELERVYSQKQRWWGFGRKRPRKRRAA